MKGDLILCNLQELGIAFQVAGTAITTVCALFNLILI